MNTVWIKWQILLWVDPVVFVVLAQAMSRRAINSPERMLETGPRLVQDLSALTPLRRQALSHKLAGVLTRFELQACEAPCNCNMVSLYASCCNNKPQARTKRVSHATICGRQSEVQVRSGWPSKFAQAAWTECPYTLKRPASMPKRASSNEV